MSKPDSFASDDPLLNNDEARREAKRAISTWYRDRALGLVPEPDSYNGVRPLWRRSTIMAWIANRSKKSGAAPMKVVDSSSLAALAAEAAHQAQLAAQAAMAAAEAARRAAASVTSNA